MVYQRRVVDGSTNNDYRVGIWMNCYDIANSSATIRVYGGTSSAPNVLLGNLTNAGLGTVNGITPSGWGLYAQNAFLWGAIVSTEGQIGGFTIGETTLKNGDLGGTTSVLMSTGTSSTTTIGGSSGSNTWAFAASNKYGVTTSGALYTSDIHASSGVIGNFTLNSGKLYSNNHSAWNTNANGIYMNSDGIAGGKQGVWYLWNDGSAKIGALTLSAAGVLSVPAANITGTLTAS